MQQVFTLLITTEVNNFFKCLFLFFFCDLQDLLRTMPSNACFCNINSTGIPRLRRILRGLAWLYPDIGYCQGTGVVSDLICGENYMLTLRYFVLISPAF